MLIATNSMVDSDILIRFLCCKRTDSSRLSYMQSFFLDASSSVATPHENSCYIGPIIPVPLVKKIDHFTLEINHAHLLEFARLQNSMASLGIGADPILDR